MTTVNLPSEMLRFGPNSGRAVAQVTPANTPTTFVDSTKSSEKPKAAESPKSGESSGGFSFRDFLSAINPLQHIPIVGTIYRAITGDTVSPAVRVLGGAILGGPIGLIASVINAVVEQATGKDIGDQALALFMPAKSAPSDDPSAQFAAAGKNPATDADTVGRDEESAAAAQIAQPSVTLHLPSTIPSAVDNAPTAALASLTSRSPQNTPPGSSEAVIGRSAPGSASARTLSDYRASAGQRLPVFDTSRSTSGGGRNTPIPLQASLPLASEPLRMAVRPAARTDIAAPATAALPAKADEPAADPSAPDHGGDWVAAAMMRGLDRYREMKRVQMQQQAPLAQRLDTSL